MQREVAELIADRSALEAQATEYKVHWVFAAQTCGRLVEERDEAVAKFEVGGARIGWGMPATPMEGLVSALASRSGQVHVASQHLRMGCKLIHRSRSHHTALGHTTLGHTALGHTSSPLPNS